MSLKVTAFLLGYMKEAAMSSPVPTGPPKVATNPAVSTQNGQKIQQGSPVVTQGAPDNANVGVQPPAPFTSTPEPSKLFANANASAMNKTQLPSVGAEKT
jgi:hypothetical protein